LNQGRSAVLLWLVLVVPCSNACRVESELLTIVSPRDILPRTDTRELNTIPCGELCKPQVEVDSIAGCRVARLDVKPHVLCQITGPHLRLQQPIAFPEGLDPASTGTVEAKWCPENLCLEAFAARMSGQAITPGTTVDGCSIEERPAYDENELFVLCTYRISSEFTFQ
jgi:hypothetical protein